MSDLWESLAAANQESDQPADNAGWGNSDAWAQSTRPNSPPKTWSRRGGSSPSKTWSRRGGSSPPKTWSRRGGSSPPKTWSRRGGSSPSRTWSRRDSPNGSPQTGSRRGDLNRTTSPSNSPPSRRQYNRGGRDRSRSPCGEREGSRSLRGNRGRGEASRNLRGNIGRNRESSRDREASRRPDFSNSPSPAIRAPNNNRGERNRRSTGSRSISPDNHFRRNRGRSPAYRNNSREKSNGPGPSWAKKETTGWGQNSSWTKKKSNNWNQGGGSGPSWTKKEPNGNGWDQSGGPAASWTKKDDDEGGGLSPWSRAAEDIKRNYNDNEIDGWGEKLGSSGPDAWNLNNDNKKSNGRSRFSPEMADDDLRFLLDGARNGDERVNWRRSRSRDREREGSRDRERSRGRERDMRRGRESRERKDDEKENESGNGGWSEGQKWRDWSINALQNSIKDINWSDFKWTDNNNTNNNQNNNNNNETTLNEREVEKQNPSNGGEIRDDVNHEPYANRSSELNHEDGELQKKPSQNDDLHKDPSDLPPLLYDPWDMDSELPQQSIIKQKNNLNGLGPSEPNAFNAPFEKEKSPSRPPGFEDVNLNNGLNPGGTVFNASQSMNDGFEEDKELLPLLNDPWASDSEEDKRVNVPNPSNWRSNGSNNAPNSLNQVNNAPNSANLGITNASISSNHTNNASNRGTNNASSSSNLGCTNSSNWVNNLSNSSNRPNKNASNSSNWANASSSKSPPKPPGFENLPTKPPGFENPVQNPPKKPQIPKPKPHQTLTSTPPKRQSESASIFKRGITDFAEEKMEPFFTKGLITGKIYACLINKFVAKVDSAIGPVEPRTEVEVHNFLRDQNGKLTRLAHEYLSMHVGQQVVQKVSRSTR